MKTIDSSFYKKIGRVLKQKRENKGYSLQDVVNKMNLYFENNNIDKHYIRQTLNKIELGKIRIDTDVFNALSYILEFIPDELFASAITVDNAEFINIDTDTIQIPVLGTIKAGIAIEAQQDILEYIDIPKSWTKGDKKFYGLRISGDSMYPKYSEKDIVIFEQTEDYIIANKKDCAVMVNGFDATFKNVTINENGITLVPFNLNNQDGYQPTFYSNEQIESLPVKIIGIAREKRVRID